MINLDVLVALLDTRVILENFLKNVPLGSIPTMGTDFAINVLLDMRAKTVR